MPRAEHRVNYHNFSGGKVSDFNPISPPENSMRILQNIDLEIDGKISRRLGLEPESNFNFPVSTSSGSWLDGNTLSEIQDLGIDFYTWKNVGDVSGVEYLVARIGNTLHVYDKGGANISDSIVQTIDISSFNSSGAGSSELGSFQGVGVKGLFICSGSDYVPFYIECDPIAQSWSTSAITFKIRDLEGVDDGLENNERPSSLSDLHKYNLQNQGWAAVDYTGNIDNRGINKFRSETGVYPSNADIEYLGNEIDGSGNPTWHADTLILATGQQNSASPKGRFIVDPFDISLSRETASGIYGLGFESTDKRPKATASFAGRVWYASVNGVVYFSQIVEGVNELGKCYQRNDPTALDFNQLLDTDGGTLKILDIGEVEVMAPLQDALVLFGTNGIWTISGGESGFTASNQFISKLSDISISSYKSLVNVEGSLVFWSEEGIYLIGKDGIQSLTEGKIQRDFNRIPNAAKFFAHGNYDRVNKVIYWAYSNYTTDTDSDIKNKYTDLLVYNVRLGAWYDYKLTNDGYLDANTDYPFVCGLLTPSARGSETRQENVYITLAGVASFRSSTSGAPKVGVTSNLIDYTETLSATGAPNEKVTLFTLSDTGRILAILTDDDESDVRYSDDGGNTWTAGDTDINDQVGTTNGPNDLAQLVAYNPESGTVIYAPGEGLAVSQDRGLTWTWIDWDGDDDFWAGGPASGGFDKANGSTGVFYDEIRSRFVAIPRQIITATSSASEWANIGFSSDGLTWTATDIKTYFTFLPNGTYTPYGVWYSSALDRMVMILTTGTSDAWVFTSEDGGESWDTGQEITGFTYPAKLVRCESLGLFLLAGWNSTEVYLSEDGLTWTSGTASHTLGQRFSVSENLGCFVAGANSATDPMLFSSDGINWTQGLDPGYSSSYFFSDYADGTSTEVVTSDSENVYVTYNVASYGSTGNQLLVAMMLPDDNGELRLTFGQFSSTTFTDWAGLTEEDLDSNSNYTVGFPLAFMSGGNYNSVVESLPQTLGENALQKQATYIHSYYDFKRDGYSEYPDVGDEFGEAEV